MAVGTLSMDLRTELQAGDINLRTVNYTDGI